jgi:hypothetical protein
VSYPLPHNSARKLTAILPQRIAQNALTILINLSQDDDVLGNLAEDDVFLETILKKITVSLTMSLLVPRLALYAFSFRVFVSSPLFATEEQSG